MRALRSAVFALALCGAATADAAAQVELTPAWGGWSRPDRVTEIAVRVQTDSATRGAVEVLSGKQSLRAALELAAGDSRRFDLTVPAAATVEAAIALEGRPRDERAIALSLSESPLLAVALADGGGAQLTGFHAVTVGANDLPRGVAAYGSVDAVVIDGTTLRALEPTQLVALIGHAAACGRLALVAPAPDAQRLLEGSAGCGARMLVSADSPQAAIESLAATLANPATTPASAADLSSLLRPETSAWPRMVAALAATFAIMSLALLLTASTRVLLIVPLLATLAIGLLLRTGEPRTRLVVWAEAAPAVRVAQYRAWQQVAGTARGDLGVPVLAGLGQPQACDAQRPVQFEVDAARGRPTGALFAGRLFDTVAVCYSGNFPVMRAVRVTPLAGGAVEIRNDGALAWPAASFVATGGVQPLPALGPGMTVSLQTNDGQPPRDAAQRAALTRTPYGGYAVLWPLALDTVTDAPVASAAWLLVPIEGPT